MTFGFDHYVPVLKLKQAEKHALADLAPHLKKTITPLFEVVRMNGTKPLDRHLVTAFKQFLPAVMGLSRYFIDTREIAAAGPVGATATFEECAKLSVAYTPVTGISRTSDVAAALKAKKRNGLALRITRTDFEKGSVSQALMAFLKHHPVEAGDVDLLVDLGAVEEMVADGISAMARDFLAQVPLPSTWRTMSLLACAFPMSMKHVDRDSHAHVGREEWIAWRDDLFAHAADLPRLPSFGDCAIQHPKGVEDFDPIKMQGSAAIRYALAEEWLLVKGRGTKKAPASIQMPALAAALVSGTHKKHFKGVTHCRGCQMIQDAAKGAPKMGSLTTWRRIGTVHHLTTVAEAVQQLPAP